jgi:RimJ/RimL family protein N-acetyltransferase
LVVNERLALRMWEPRDAEPLAEIYRQPEYLETMPPANAATQIAMWRAGWEEDGFSQWAACDPVSGLLVGRIGLIRHHDWPLASDPAEVGWVLDREWWGRGLATEGGRASIEAWRAHLPDDRLYSFTAPENRRSRAVMARLELTLRWHHAVARGRVRLVRARPLRKPRTLPYNGALVRRYHISRLVVR